MEHAELENPMRDAGQDAEQAVRGGSEEKSEGLHHFGNDQIELIG